MSKDSKPGECQAKAELQAAWGSVAYLLRLKEDAERRWLEAYKKADALEKKFKEEYSK